MSISEKKESSQISDLSFYIGDLKKKYKQKPKFIRSIDIKISTEVSKAENKKHTGRPQVHCGVGSRPLQEHEYCS